MIFTVMEVAAAGIQHLYSTICHHSSLAQMKRKTVHLQNVWNRKFCSLVKSGDESYGLKTSSDKRSIKQNVWRIEGPNIHHAEEKPFNLTLTRINAELYKINKYTFFCISAKRSCGQCGGLSQNYCFNRLISQRFSGEHIYISAVTALQFFSQFTTAPRLLFQNIHVQDDIYAYILIGRFVSKYPCPKFCGGNFCVLNQESFVRGTLCNPDLSRPNLSSPDLSKLDLSKLDLSIADVLYCRCVSFQHPLSFSLWLKIVFTIFHQFSCEVYYNL